MDDTSLSFKKKMNELFQLRSPQEKLEMGSSMFQTSKDLIVRSILEKNPSISKKELKQELFLRFYADDFDNANIEKILKHLSQQP